ncbi:MAG TPA: hypothetical protein VN107_08470 [Microbacterium sp.]|nr:hypothetical protein [Microbacterium sp.]
MTGADPRRSKAPAGSIDALDEPVHLVPPVEPSPARLAGRVFAYLGLTVLWAVLLAIVLFATVAVLPGALGADLGTSPFATRSDAWMGVLVVPLVLAPIFGFITVFLVLATTGMTLSAATLFVRSLNPSYRHEQLSTTVKAVKGEAVGPVTTAYTGVAVSLLPVRLTRWAKVVMIIQFNGWIFNGSTLVLGYLWGLLYFFTLAWTLWPATGIAVPICAVITALLVIWLLITIWRRRRRYPEVMPSALEGTVYARSWPNRPAERKPAARRRSAAASKAARKRS